MLKKHQTENVKQIMGQKARDVEALEKNFQNLTDKLTDKFKADNELTRRETKSRLMHKDRVQAREMQTLRNETKAMVTGGSALDNQKDKEKRIVDGYENRLKHLKNKMEEVKFKNQEDKERINKLNQRQIADVEKVSNKKLESKNDEMRDYRDKIVKKSQEKMQNTIDVYKKELRATKSEKIQQGLNASDKSKQLLNSQRTEYARNMIDMQEQNKNLVADLQDQSKRESSELIQKTRKDTHHKLEDLKADMRDTMEKRESSLNKRLDSQMKKNTSLTHYYENKLTNIKNKSAEEINNVRMLSDERRAADTRTFKREFENVGKNMQMELMQLKGNFERQLSTAKRDQDKSITKLTRNYEAKLSNERKDHTRTMAKRLESARADYERLYKQSELEKATLKNQFEIQMANLRQTFQDQAEEKVAERSAKMANNA